VEGEESRKGKSLFRFGFMQAVVLDKGRQHRQLGKITQGEEASQRPIDEQYVGDRAQYRAIFGKTLAKVRKLKRKRPGKRL
jgi:hypothetical protein